MEIRIPSRICRRCHKPFAPGETPNFLTNPDDAYGGETFIVHEYCFGKVMEEQRVAQKTNRLQQFLHKLTFYLSEG